MLFVTVVDLKEPNLPFESCTIDSIIEANAIVETKENIIGHFIFEEVLDYR